MYVLWMATVSFIVPKTQNDRLLNLVGVLKSRDANAFREYCLNVFQSRQIQVRVFLKCRDANASKNFHLNFLILWNEIKFNLTYPSKVPLICNWNYKFHFLSVANKLEKFYQNISGQFFKVHIFLAIFLTTKNIW